MRCASDSASPVLEQNHVAADFVLQFRGRAQRDQLALVQDGEAVAALGFFHQVSGHNDRDALLIAQNLQVLPEIAAGARIEPGRRLVQQQH